MPKNCGSNWSIAVDEAAALRDRFAGHARLRIVKTLDVPAIRRHLDDAFAAFDEKLPKRVGVIDSAGETATDSDDCNTFFWHGRALRRRGATDQRRLWACQVGYRSEAEAV